MSLLKEGVKDHVWEGGKGRVLEQWELEVPSPIPALDPLPLKLQLELLAPSQPSLSPVLGTTSAAPIQCHYEDPGQ